MAHTTGNELRAPQVLANIPIELLLSSPPIWSAKKISTFIRDCHVFLHKDESSIKREFRELLDISARECQLFPPNDNLEPSWEIVLDPSHREVLTSYVTNNGARRLSINYSSLVALLGVIRNKYDHRNELPVEHKTLLGWYQRIVVNGQTFMAFDDNLFADYWITRLPKLTTFLWEHFVRFQENFKYFYDHPLQAQYQDMNGHWSVNFSALLSKALADQCDEGGLDARYEATHDASTHTLDFRTLQNIQKILNGHDVVELDITGNGLKCRWYFINELTKSLQLDTERETTLKNPFPDEQIFSGKVFLTSKLCEVNVNWIVNQCASLRESKMIVFTNRYTPQGEDIIQDILKNHIIKKISDTGVTLLKIPLTFESLGEGARKKIAQQGIVSIQGTNFPLKDILPGNERQQQVLLNTLRVPEYNVLLQGKVLRILTKREIPSLSPVYLERSLYRKNHVTLDVVLECQTDIFVVINTNIEVLKNKFLKRFDQVKAVNLKKNVFNYRSGKINNKDFRIFVSKDETDTIANIYEAYQRHYNGEQSVHFIRYSHASVFELVATRGSIANISELYHDVDSESKKLNESELVLFFDRIRSTERNVFIAGKEPGIGKTQLLNKLAKQLNENGSFVLFTSFTEIEQQCNKNKQQCNKNKQLFSKQDIADVLVNLACNHNNQFEKGLMRKCLLSNDATSSRLRFEIMIDDLDVDIEEYSKNGIVRFLKIVRNEMPSVRVWVTMNGAIQDVTCEEFCSMVFVLEPFSEQQQLACTEKIMIFEEGGRVSDDVARIIKKTAKMCLRTALPKKYNKYKNTPVWCRLLVELYKNPMEKVVLRVDKTIERVIKRSRKKSKKDKTQVATAFFLSKFFKKIFK